MFSIIIGNVITCSKGILCILYDDLREKKKYIYVVYSLNTIIVAYNGVYK